MLPTSVPEIQRTNLGNTVLSMKAMGVNDLLHFDFMDPPPVQTLVGALEDSYNLGALDEEGLLTRSGRKMAEFPSSRPVQDADQSVDLACSDEILTVVAMLSVQNIWYRPREKQAQADQKRRSSSSRRATTSAAHVYEAWAASSSPTRGASRTSSRRGRCARAGRAQAAARRSWTGTSSTS